MVHEFDSTHRGAPQGDLMVFRLTDAEASRLGGVELKPARRGVIRLLEGEVTGHHHEIVLGAGETRGSPRRPKLDDGANTPSLTQVAEAAATTALGLARARASAATGKATLRGDETLARSLPWLTRTDLMIGFLKVEAGPVVLRHPEHESIRLPAGVYYVGRQVESAGAEERMVAD